MSTPNKSDQNHSASQDSAPLQDDELSASFEKFLKVSTDWIQSAAVKQPQADDSDLKYVTEDIHGQPLKNPMEFNFDRSLAKFKTHEQRILKFTKDMEELDEVMQQCIDAQVRAAKRVISTKTYYNSKNVEKYHQNQAYYLEQYSEYVQENTRFEELNSGILNHIPQVLRLKLPIMGLVLPLRASAICTMINKTAMDHSPPRHSMDVLEYSSKSFELMEHAEQNLRALWMNVLEKQYQVAKGKIWRSELMGAFKRCYPLFARYFVGYAMAIDTILDELDFLDIKMMQLESPGLSKDSSGIGKINDVYTLGLRTRCMVREALMNYFLATSPYRIWELLHHWQTTEPLFGSAVLNPTVQKGFMSFILTGTHLRFRSVRFKRPDRKRLARKRCSLISESELMKLFNGDSKKKTVKQVTTTFKVNKSPKNQNSAPKVSNAHQLSEDNLVTIRNSYQSERMSHPARPVLISAKLSRRNNLVLVEGHETVFRKNDPGFLESILDLEFVWLEQTTEYF